jgi:hypothetical protein
MSQINLKKPISVFMITLFAFSLVTVTVSRSAGPDNVVKGTIVSIDPVSGMLEIQSDEGKTVMLNANPQTDDLKSLQKGDQVKIQYDKDKMVQSIEKEG